MIKKEVSSLQGYKEHDFEMISGPSKEIERVIFSSIIVMIISEKNIFHFVANTDGYIYYVYDFSNSWGPRFSTKSEVAYDNC